ncbi:MAG: geranylgeranyl pyrophosphate synthase [Gammaproteobacteria bacterium]|jgi:octaprenyl-diphosphate synthase|nr:geranylgeranyl pyrophosphate synthase [Gammaproteobacteria bacterium]
MNIAEIRTLVQTDMQRVEDAIDMQLKTERDLIYQLSNHLISSGGKRIRPLLLVLCAQALNYQGNAHIELGAIIELIHTATLIHDDVVDDSKLRRGRKTTKEIWGNEASVLVGDFLYSRTFQMMVKLQNLGVMQVIADTTNVMASGEVLQLMNRNNPDITEQDYLDVIYYKTASLFEAAAKSSALISEQPETITTYMADYGKNLGIAFQLIDDVLDYSADPQELGKNIGDDLAEGKTTLPLLYALRHCSKEQQQTIRIAIKDGSLDSLPKIQQAIATTQAVAYTQQRANHHAQLACEALENIPSSIYRDALIALTEFAISRNT